eukprot:g4272.t1
MVSGYSPPLLTGGWSNSPVPLVKSSARPAPRPKNEIFFELKEGTKMPATGLGTCCRPTAYDPESIYNSVLHYLLMGGRLVDTAELYLNHKSVGRALTEAMRRGIPREEIFLETKLCTRFFANNDPVKRVEIWLQELNVEYIDLVLLHHPESTGGLPFAACKNGSAQECRMNAWVKLSGLREQGTIKNLGVSNFQIKQIEQLTNAENLAPVTVNQIQYNPFAPQWQHDVVKYCQNNDILVQAWGLFQGTMMQHNSVFAIKKLKALAEKRNVSPAQIFLKWALQKDIGSIPGTGNIKHMRENLQVYDLADLSDEEMDTIDSFQANSEGFKAMGFDKNES